MATRIEDYYKEDADSYKKRILKMGETRTVEKTRKIKKVKTRKTDNFKYNVEIDYVDYNAIPFPHLHYYLQFVLRTIMMLITVMMSMKT